MNEIKKVYKDRYIKLKCRVIYLELERFFDIMMAYDLKVVKIGVDEKRSLVLADIENVDTKEKKTITFYESDFDTLFRRKLKYKDIVKEMRSVS